MLRPRGVRATRNVYGERLNTVCKSTRGNYNSIDRMQAWVVIALNRYVREGDFNGPRFLK